MLLDRELLFDEDRPAGTVGPQRGLLAEILRTQEQIKARSRTVPEAPPRPDPHPAPRSPVLGQAVGGTGGKG